MSQISSINFKKSVDYQVFHNSTIRPSYVIGGELECDPPKGYDAQRIKNEIVENAKRAKGKARPSQELKTQETYFC